MNLDTAPREVLKNVCMLLVDEAQWTDIRGQKGEEGPAGQQVAIHVMEPVAPGDEEASAATAKVQDSRTELEKGLGIRIHRVWPQGEPDYTPEGASPPGTKPAGASAVQGLMAAFRRVAEEAGGLETHLSFKTPDAKKGNLLLVSAYDPLLPGMRQVARSWLAKQAG